MSLILGLHIDWVRPTDVSNVIIGDTISTNLKLYRSVMCVYVFTCVGVSVSFVFKVTCYKWVGMETYTSRKTRKEKISKVIAFTVRLRSFDSNTSTHSDCM